METWKKVLLRSAGFGAGAALTLILLGAAGYAWMNRAKHWSDKAVTARYSSLGAEKSGEEVRLKVGYALTNNTKESYTIPSTVSGNLMRRLPNDNSLAKLQDVEWDQTLTIPPGQTVNEQFTIHYKLADYNMTSSDIPAGGDAPSKEFVSFLNKRLEEMNGLVFYDFINNYRIDMPSGWGKLDSASDKK